MRVSERIKKLEQEPAPERQMLVCEQFDGETEEEVIALARKEANLSDDEIGLTVVVRRFRARPIP